MTNLKKVVHNKLSQFSRVPDEFLACIGNLATNEILVEGTTSTIYITLLNGEIQTALNVRVPQIFGQLVFVGKDPNNMPHTLQVLRIWDVYEGEIEAHKPNYHREQHEWPNGDTPYVHGEIFYPSLYQPVDGQLKVNIYPGAYRISTGFKVTKSITTVDLTASMPAENKVRIAVIVVTAAGNFVVRNGPEITGVYRDLNASHIPELTLGDSAICAVKIFHNQVDFRMDGYINDFIDLRFTSSGGGAAPGSVSWGTISGTLSDQADLQGELDDKVGLDVLADTKDPTGWLDPLDITVSYDSTTRKITLSGALEYYWHGVKKTLASPWTSSAHEDTYGNWFLYTADGVNFIWNSDPWLFSYAMVAKVTYQAGYKFGLREVHSTMPWQVHKELHEQVSAYRESGGSLIAGTYAENSAVDADITPSFDAAYVNDEDLPTLITAWSQGTYTTMKIGASSVPEFVTTSSFPFRHTASGYINYNNTTTGADVQGATGKYYNVYQILVPVTADVESQKYRMIMLQPQREFGSLATAQAEDPRSLTFGTLLSAVPEFVLYARITYVTNASYGSTGKVAIAPGGVSYLAGSKLGQISVIGFTPTAHNNLTGLQGGTLDEYYHLTAAQHTVMQNTSGTNTGDQDLSGYLKKDGSNDPFTGTLDFDASTDIVNIQIAKALDDTAPAFRLYKEPNVNPVASINADGSVNFANLSGTNTGDAAISSPDSTISVLSTGQNFSLTVSEANLAHNDIGSKQGGTTNEYYHLTAAQHTTVSNLVPPLNEAGATNNFLTSYNALTGAFSKARPTWANVDKTTSSIADITTRSHTALTDIGTNTHAQIDTALTRLANTSGTNTGNQSASDFSHNDLGSLQGGSSTERYHLSSANATKVENLTVGTTTSWTPRLYGTTSAGEGSYSQQAGYYYRIGNMVFIQGALTWTGHTGTGNMRVDGLPFTVANTGINQFLIVSWSNLTLGNVGNKVFFNLAANTTYGSIVEIAGGAATALAMDTAGTFNFSGVYII